MTTVRIKPKIYEQMKAVARYRERTIQAQINKALSEWLEQVNKTEDDERIQEDETATNKLAVGG